MKRWVSALAMGLLSTALVVGNAGAAPTIQSAPQLSGISPGFGSPGDAIEITGDHLTDGNGPPKVTFLSLYEGSVIQFSETKILVVVPTIPDPPSDGRPIELRVTTSAGSASGPFMYYGSTSGLGAPTSLKAKARKGKVTLTWKPPVTGAASVTSYQWSVSLSGTDRWSKWKTVGKGNPRARKQTVKRIRPGKDYVFLVRAMAGDVAGPEASILARGKRLAPMGSVSTAQGGGASLDVTSMTADFVDHDSQPRKSKAPKGMPTKRLKKLIEAEQSGWTYRDCANDPGCALTFKWSKLSWRGTKKLCVEGYVNIGCVEYVTAHVARVNLLITQREDPDYWGKLKIDMTQRGYWANGRKTIKYTDGYGAKESWCEPLMGCGRDLYVWKDEFQDWFYAFTDGTCCSRTRLT